ncbi:hypothetical protein LR392_00030 [Arthrobacter sp. AK04]|uniref:hypothetical protein n=1 Tax=Arthrobacter sp. AK04 TaxID=2900048 RepID=UPI001E2DC13A|nr:hypothetical protein [Arthrobacter sp. AK04]MCD5340610.1 hypothetical protein [Arthrobacter sp. AK04]
MFKAMDPTGDLEVSISTPLTLNPAFEAMPFSIHSFAMKDLRESSIHPVHLAGVVKGDPPRIGLMVPANALGSIEHDEAEKPYFQQYAYMAIRLALADLLAKSPGILEDHLDGSEPLLFSDLFHDNICFLVVSESTLSEVPNFGLDRILPSLIKYGYVPAGACKPADLEWIGAPPESQKIKVSLVSEDVENSNIVAKLLTLSATSSPSLLTQFFYLYQVFEYLMESVMRHRLPLVVQEMIDSLQNGTASARDQFDLLGDEIREKGRLKLLMEKYSDCSSSLREFGVAASDFLDARGIKSNQGIEAVYKVRNFLFHQARDLPSHDDPLLANVVEAFSQFLPSLLESYKHPSAQAPVSADSPDPGGVSAAAPATASDLGG